MTLKKDKSIWVVLILSVICVLISVIVLIIGMNRHNAVCSDIDSVNRSVVTVVKGIDTDKKILTSDVAIGSGFCIRPGVILTNYHNVGGENEQINVITYDDKVIHADVAAYDEQSDVALLSVDAEIPALTLSDKKAETGDKVFNLSTPISAYLRGTYSEGMITNTDVVGFDIQRLLQTNIELSPGCSGSPLLDGKNRVVGMITFKSTEFGAEGLGFAIPSNQLTEIIDMLNQGKSMPDLKLTFEKDIYQKYGLPGAGGLAIQNIGENSIAENKLKVGDIITDINGQSIRNTADFNEALRKAAAAQELSITVIRDQKTQIIEMGEVLS